MGMLVRSVLDNPFHFVRRFCAHQGRFAMSQIDLASLDGLIAAASNAREGARERTTLGDRLNQTPVSLNERRQIAIELIASGKSYRAVAKTIGIDPGNLYRWRQEPEFRERLANRLRELWGEPNERLKSMIQPSLEVVAEQ